MLTEKKNIRKKRILKAALQCFTTHGYAKTTFSDVAKTAGISRASLYSYFTNKEELFIVLIKDLHDVYLKSSRELLKADLTDAEKLYSIIRVWMIDPYSRIMKNPYGNSWFDELGNISVQTERRYQEPDRPLRI